MVTKPLSAVVAEREMCKEQEGKQTTLIYTLALLFDQADIINLVKRRADREQGKYIGPYTWS